MTIHVSIVGNVSLYVYILAFLGAETVDVVFLREPFAGPGFLRLYE